MDPPAADGGRRILRYECEMRRRRSLPGSSIERRALPELDAPANRSASPRRPSPSLAMTILRQGDVRITNGTTYTFRVRAVNAREGKVKVDENGSGTRTEHGDGDWSNEATARPTDRSGTQRTFTISATIDGKSWARAGELCHDSRNGRRGSEVHGAAHRAVGQREQHSQERGVWADEQHAGRLVHSQHGAGRRPHYRAVGQRPDRPDRARRQPFQRLGGYQRGDPPRRYPRPADGAGGDAGRQGSDAVLGHRRHQPRPRRLPVPAGAATGFLWALDGLCGRRVRQWRRDQQYGHRPHQRRDVRLPGAGYVPGVSE